MRSIRFSLFLVLGAVAACGDDGGSSNPDAGPTVDAAPDAPQLPPGCDYAELMDGANEMTPEASGLSFGTAATTFCGKVNTGHFDPTEMVADVDLITFTVTAPAMTTIPTIATLTGTGLDALTGVDFALITSLNNMNRVLLSGVFLGNHAVGLGNLPAGNYVLAVFGGNGAAIPADIDYKVKVEVDTPDTRCVKSVATAAYTEGPDNPQNHGNDMVDVRFNPMMGQQARALTAATDAPETSGITAEAGMTYRISGVNGANNAADEYIDRDTYLFTTGTTTTRLNVRLNWPGTTSDLDFILFPAGMTGDFASGTLVGNTEDEFTTFAVKPNTMYWLWVGEYDKATPVAGTYDVTMCAEAFAP